MRIMFPEAGVSRYAFNDIVSVLGGRTGRWGAPLFSEALGWLRLPAIRSYARSSGVGLYGRSRYRPAETMDIVSAETSLWPTTTSSVPRSLIATVSGSPGLVVGGRAVTIGTSADAAKARNTLRRLRLNGRRSNGGPKPSGTAVGRRTSSAGGSSHGHSDFHWSNAIDLFLTGPPHPVPGPLTLLVALLGAAGILFLVLKRRTEA